MTDILIPILYLGWVYGAIITSNGWSLFGAIVACWGAAFWKHGKVTKCQVK